MRNVLVPFVVSPSLARRASISARVPAFPVISTASQQKGGGRSQFQALTTGLRLPTASPPKRNSSSRFRLRRYKVAPPPFDFAQRVGDSTACSFSARLKPPSFSAAAYGTA